MDNTDIEERLNDVIEKFMLINEFDNHISYNHINSMIEILSKIYQRSKKADDLLKIMNPTKEEKAAYKEFTKALVGLKFNVSKMILAQEVKKGDADIVLEFSNANYDNTVNDLQSELSEYIEFIEMLHNVYSWVELQAILGATHTDNPSISAAMVERYEEHKKDLKLLKKVIREELPEKYNEVFKKDNRKLHNYLGYIKYPKDTTIEDFYKYIKELLNKVDTDDARKILERINLEKFMLKQNSRTNPKR